MRVEKRRDVRKDQQEIKKKKIRKMQNKRHTEEKEEEVRMQSET